MKSLQPQVAEAKAKSQKRKAVAVAAPARSLPAKGGKGKFQNHLAAKPKDEIDSIDSLTTDARVKSAKPTAKSSESSEWWALPEVCVEKPEAKTGD